MAKTKAKKSGVEVGVWQARIAAAKLMFARERRKREEYERSLALDDGLTDWSAFDNISQAYGSSTLKKVPLSYRYTVWLQAQTAGDPPIIKYPRNATGDETFAVTVEELLGRVHLESGAHREWAQGIFDIAGAGSTCIWYGFHADVVTPEEVEGASEGAGQTVERALQGDIEAKPGQDNAMAARALDTTRQDEINRIAMPIEAQGALVMAAGAQDMAAVEAAEMPNVPSVTKRELWARRLKVGVDLIWDQTVSDLRDCRWMARRCVMTMEAAKAYEGFTASARRDLPLQKFGPSDGVEAILDVQGQPYDSPENGRFVFWEVWDKEYGTRHYVCETGGEYLEKDESYPYPHPETGEPAIPGFFPCVVSAPIKHGLNNPERTMGVPLISPGFGVQREIESLYDFAMASVKRHSVRMYEVPEDLDEDTAAKLESGVDGTLVRRTPGIEPGQMALPIQFTGEAYKIVDLIGRLQGLWATLQGMPMADLTSMPQADTATAELKSLEAGRNQADFVIRQIESDMARGVEIQRAMLSIGLYPPERIAALLGPGKEGIIQAWQSSSLEGDHIILKSASRAKAEQAVRIKQLGDALSLVMGFVDPKMGLPVFDGTPIVEEILLSLDVGQPKRIQWTPQDLMMRAAMTGGAPQEGGDKGKDSGGEAPKRGQGPPTTPNQVGAARRVGT